MARVLPLPGKPLVPKVSTAAIRDLSIGAAIWLGTMLVGMKFQVFEAFHELTREYEDWDIDELALGIVVFAVLMSVFAYRRWRETVAAMQKLRVAVAEQAQMEQARQHGQKLESLGVLAGGISHEINNMLLPILALSELTLRELPDGSPSRPKIEAVLDAGRHCRELVGQIMVFGRQTDEVIRPLDIQQSIMDAGRLILPTMPSNIVVIQDLCESTLIVNADPTQISQVLLNLVTNAADAIGHRPGSVTISLDGCSGTKCQSLIGPHCEDRDYALLTVRDDGEGMNHDVAARAFDPFFTTKEVGKGSGIGLAAIHGIVTKLDGYAAVESEKGVGTAIHICLPLAPKDSLHGAHSGC